MATSHNPLSTGGLDSFDVAILEILQADNTTPLRTIGQTVNLSAAAVQRRVKRMRENGIIVGKAIDKQTAKSVDIRVERA